MTSRSARTRAFAESLKVSLPAEDLRPLLQACLLTGEIVQHAWEQWLRTAPDPKRHLSTQADLKRFLPLLYTNLSRNAAAIARDLQPYLRTALVCEESRCERFRRYCRQALATLIDAGIDVVLLKGVALAETVYADPVLRHCHDIDLLVGEEEIDRAATALTRSDFRRTSGTVSTNDVTLRHDCGLPIELHTQLLSHCTQYAPENCTDVIDSLGVPVRVLSPADMLVHVCGHAATTGRGHLLGWVCDSYLLLRRNPELDWMRFLDLTKRTRLEIPMLAMLSFLATALDGPIPADVLGKLHAEIAAAAEAPNH